MNKTQIEIQVNLKKQFYLLKNNTFKDPLCFVDENIQNAQRAGSKNIHVTVKNDYISFVNDGDVLNDHSVLFNMGESSWSEEVMEEQTPFGLGFFSNISISNDVKITSGSIKTTYSEENSDIEIFSEDLSSSDEIRGFKLEIFNYNTEKVSMTEIIERAKQLGAYVQDINIFVNGVEQKKINIGEGKGFAFEHLVSGKGFSGFIYLNHKNFFHSSGIDIFHNGRFVKRIDDVYYVFGEIHVDNTVLNLESPDRKDIIKDSLYDTFVSELKKYADTMVSNIIKNAPDEFIKLHESSISFYADFYEALKTYSLNFISNDKTKTSIAANLDKYAIFIEQNNLESVHDLELFLSQNEEKENESNKEDIVFTLSKNEAKGYANEAEKGSVVNDLFNTEADSVHHYSNLSEIIEDEEDGYSSSETTSYSSSRNNKSDVKVEKKSIVLDKPSFWLEFKDIPKYSRNIEIAKKYGVVVYIVQNSFEKRLLLTAHSSYLQHVKELEICKIYESHISNLELSSSEKRATQLLFMLSRLFGYEKNIFTIGDVLVSETTAIPSIGFSEENVIDNYNVIANVENEMIYIDRSAISTFLLDDSNSDNLNLSDFKFILFNIENIIKELRLINNNISEKNMLNSVLTSLAMA